MPDSSEEDDSLGEGAARATPSDGRVDSVAVEVESDVFDDSGVTALAPAGEVALAAAVEVDCESEAVVASESDVAMDDVDDDDDDFESPPYW